MGFKTQRMANAFPLWTKIRKDPSSVGQKMFSVFSEMLEEHLITAVKLQEDEHLLKRHLGVGRIYGISLDDADLYPTSGTDFGVTKYTYPTVVGTTSSVPYTCTRAIELVEFLNAPPDRLVSKGSESYSSTQCFVSTAPATYANPVVPERLCVVVSGSTFYSRPSARQDREYTGRHTVFIKGTDENDISISEYVTILDDGVHYTHNIFKTVTEVITEGFDGTCTVSWLPVANSYELDPYRSAVFDDFEGQLRLSISNQEVSSTTYSYVEYSSTQLKLGNEYRRPSIEVLDNTETLAEVVLLNASGNPYTAVDLAINHETSKLYVLDDQGVLHVYDHELSSFTNTGNADTETSRTHLELIPLRHRAKFGDTEYMYTDFARNRSPIGRVEIKRVSPSGITRYLQTDKTTWGASPAWITAPFPDASTAEGTWQDIRFSNEYDEMGQWEFSAKTETAADTTIYTTAVQVGSLIAERSIATTLSNVDGLSFSKEGYVAISDGTDVHWFEEVADVWLADVRLGQVLLRSEYDTVEVTY